MKKPGITISDAINIALPNLFNKHFLPLLKSDKVNINDIDKRISELNRDIDALGIPKADRQLAFDDGSARFFTGLLRGARENEENFHKDKKTGERVLKMERIRMLRVFAEKLFAHYFSHAMQTQRVGTAMFITGLIEFPYPDTSIPYVDAIAETNDPVMIIGETGTGKELLAKTVHCLSLRGRSVFISINCGGINEETLQSELFGHVKGAFTGAIQDRKGAFEIANEGTLFLDEVGDMPPKVQTALLRTLNDGMILRMGDIHGKEIQTNVRIIAATNKNLQKEVQEGRFREDLFYRLCVHQLRLPPFRSLHENDRLYRIRRMIDTVLKEQSGSNLSSALRGLGYLVPCYNVNEARWIFPLDQDDNERLRWPISKEAIEILLNYTFPGNYRELHAVISNAWVKTKQRIEVEHLPEYILSNIPVEDMSSLQAILMSPEKEFSKKMQDLEKKRLIHFLEQAYGNVSEAARIMKIPRHILAGKMKRLGLTSSKGKTSEF